MYLGQIVLYTQDRFYCIPGEVLLYTQTDSTPSLPPWNRLYCIPEGTIVYLDKFYCVLVTVIVLLYIWTGSTLYLEEALLNVYLGSSSV